MKFDSKFLWKGMLGQGLLKIWTEHSHWFLLISIPFEEEQKKFQHFYNLGRNEFSPNLKGVAQKMDPPRPFEVLDIFGGKSKSNAPKVFKFGTKRVPIEVNNWWKFGADISNHFWEIENWNFFGLSLPPSWKENNFQKLFSFQLGGDYLFRATKNTKVTVWKRIIFKN